MSHVYAEGRTMNKTASKYKQIKQGLNIIRKAIWLPHRIDNTYGYHRKDTGWERHNWRTQWNSTTNQKGKKITQNNSAEYKGAPKTE